MRNSEWLLTINTNQKYRDADELAAGVRSFYLGLQSVFGSVDAVEEILKVLPEEDTFRDSVGIVQSNAVIENAASGLHAHVQLKVCHTTKLSINLPGLRKVLNEAINPEKKVYVNVQHVMTPSLSVREYIYKNVRGRRLRMCDGEEFPDSVEVKPPTMAIARLGIHNLSLPGGKK